jgi:hypothetical protein
LSRDWPIAWKSAGYRIEIVYRKPESISTKQSPSARINLDSQSDGHNSLDGGGYLTIAEVLALAVKLPPAGHLSRFCAGQAARSTSSSTMRGEMVLPSINTSAKEIGSLNRRGPALPGLMKKMPSRRSIRGL